MCLYNKQFLYGDSEQYLEIKKELDNGLFLNVHLFFHQRKFLEFQKNLIQDFIADLSEELLQDSAEFSAIRSTFELKLQELNTKLTTFAEKLQAVEVFNIDGFIQLVSFDTLVSSLIGNVSLMIFRDKRLYYELYNSVYEDTKIDVFSDFIEGEIESRDELIYIGNDFKNLVDIDSVYDMQEHIGLNTSTSDSHFDANSGSALDSRSFTISMLIDQVLESQGKQANANFLVGCVVDTSVDNRDKTASFISSNFSKISKFTGYDKISKFTGKMKKSLIINKYYVTVVILIILILFMLYNVLNQLLQKQNVDKFLTESGVEVTLTIDKLKNEIYEFKTMNPKSNQKSEKYSEIVKKMDLLESKEKWLDDVSKLRKVLEKDYYDGFNINLISDMKTFNDATLGTTAQTLTFNTTEQSKLGALKSISYHRGLYIGGEKGAMVDSLNDGSRGALIEYLIENPMQSCTMNLLRNGMYCYTANGELFNVTKEGIVPVTIVDSFVPDTIGGVSVYGKINMYIFQPNMKSSLPGVFVTKYTNERGSQISFTNPRNYTLLDIATGAISELDGNFSSMAIDGNFLVWSNKKLYQLWRPTSAGTLDVRQVPLMGGDKLSSLSDDVKVISHYGSKYVYLYDRKKTTFSVYVSDPSKTLEKAEKSYNLSYLFSFKFNLSGEEKIIDIDVDAKSSAKPEAYILTNTGVYKVNLYSFIDSYS